MDNHGFFLLQDQASSHCEVFLFTVDLETQNWAGWYTTNTQSCIWDALSLNLSWTTGYPDRYFPLSLQLNASIVSSNKSWQQPPKTLTTHCSWLYFHLIQCFTTSAAETVLLNNLKNQSQHISSVIMKLIAVWGISYLFLSCFAFCLFFDDSSTIFWLIGDSCHTSGHMPKNYLGFLEPEYKWGQSSHMAWDNRTALLYVILYHNY
jgi:hypothetical protein